MFEPETFRLSVQLSQRTTTLMMDDNEPNYFFVFWFASFVIRHRCAQKVFEGHPPPLQLGINYAFFCYDVVAIAVLMGHCAWYSFIIAGVAFSGTALFEAVSGADAADLRPHLHYVLARYVYIWPLWSAMRKIRLCQSPVLCMFLHIQLVYVHNTRHV